MCWSNSEIQYLKNKGGGETIGGLGKGQKIIKIYCMKNI